MRKKSYPLDEFLGKRPSPSDKPATGSLKKFSDPTLKAEFARKNRLKSFLVDYKIYGDPLYLWQAYQHARKHDLPLPSEITKYFDRCAAELLKLHADGVSNVNEVDITTAVGMKVERCQHRTDFARRQKLVAALFDVNLRSLRLPTVIEDPDLPRRRKAKYDTVEAIAERHSVPVSTLKKARAHVNRHGSLKGFKLSGTK